MPAAQSQVEPEKENFAELLASTDLIQFGPYQVNRRTGEVRKHDLKIRLSGQPFEVLSLLLERPGDIVTREEIRQRLWSNDIFVDFERSLNSAVKKLRRALNDNPDNPHYIETLPRKGYRFIGTIEPPKAASLIPAELLGPAAGAGPVAFDAGLMTDLPSPGAAADVTTGMPSASPRRAWTLAGAVGFLVALAMVAVVIYRAERRSQSISPTVKNHSVNFQSSIAVLGFKNLSSSRDADWLSRAITQMLSTELGSGEKMRIVSEEATSKAKMDLGLKDTDGYPREVLRALRTSLGNDYVVTGSYVALGDKSSGSVRVDLRLQETISGETLASIAVSGKQSEILDLVAKAGQEMRGKLGSRVPPGGDVDWRTVLPADAEAARLYSEGLVHLHLYENLNAAELLQKSVAIDPSFALGHAALAEAWSGLGYDANALSSAEKAVSQANSLPEDVRFEIEGRYYELKQDWPGAIGAYSHLLQDFPDDLESGLKLAAAQTSAGHLNDALVTLSGLRALPSSQRDDARIDLAEAALAAHSSDYKRQQSLAERAAQKAQSSLARMMLAHAKLVQGWALDDQSQLKEAKEAYSSARQIFEQAGDWDGTATALNDLGIVFQKEGDLSAAAQALTQALGYFRRVGDEDAVAGALTNLGEVYRVQGSLGQAESLYREAMELFRKTGKSENELIAQNNLANVLYQKGDFAGAGKVFEALLAAHRASGDKSGTALVQANLGEVLRVQGQLGSAATLLKQSVAGLREIGDQSSAAQAGVGLAKILMAQGDLDGATKVLTEALATNQEVGAKGDAALDRILLAEVSMEQGHPEHFESAARPAIEELKREQRSGDQAEAEAIRAQALLSQGRIAEASQSIQTALAIKSAENLASFRVAVAAAEMDAARGRTEVAIQNLQAAIVAAKQTGCLACQFEARLALGKIEMKSGSTAAGRSRLRQLQEDARAKGFKLIAQKAMS